MQRSLAQSGRCAQPLRASSRRPQPFAPAQPARGVTCSAAASSTQNGKPANGNGAHTQLYPTPAQTIRTLVDIVSEGTLSSVGEGGQPVGIPVTFATDKQGGVQLHLDRAAIELANLQAGSLCSLTVQATTMPARAVAAVTLVGKVDVPADASVAPLEITKCIYFGGLDQVHRGQVVSREEFAAAEPDVLRKAAPDLVNAWNSERAEDIYRIVSQFMGVPLTEMHYAELLWVDQLGMYIRAEVAGREGPTVVRVPFIRAVLDERDARSAITMGAQIAWERDRAYTPPLPSIFADAAANN